MKNRVTLRTLREGKRGEKKVIERELLHVGMVIDLGGGGVGRRVRFDISIHFPFR